MPSASVVPAPPAPSRLPRRRAVAATVGAVALMLYACGGGLWLVGRYMGYGLGPTAMRTYDMRPLPCLSSGTNAAYWWCAFVGWPLLLVLPVLLLHSLWAKRLTRAQTATLVLVTTVLAVGLAPLGPLCRLAVWPPRLGSLSGFERMSGMTLPPGTVLIEARGYKGWKQIVQARLQLPRASVNQFIASSFAASVTWPGGEAPRPEVKRIRRDELQQGWYYIQEDWYRPVASVLLAATVSTNDGSDNHHALLLVEPGADRMADVFLQYDRG